MPKYPLYHSSLDSNGVLHGLSVHGLGFLQHSPMSNAFQAQIMGQCWNRGSFWYFQAAHSPKGLCRVFNEHIQRRFREEHCTQRVFDQTVSPYWCTGADDFIQQQVKEEAEYKDRPRKRFNRNDRLIG